MLTPVAPNGGTLSVFVTSPDFTQGRGRQATVAEAVPSERAARSTRRQSGRQDRRR